MNGNITEEIEKRKLMRFGNVKKITANDGSKDIRVDPS